MGIVKKDEFNGVAWIPHKYFTCDVCGADCNQDAPNPKFWAYEYIEDGTVYCWDCLKDLFSDTVKKAE